MNILVITGSPKGERSDTSRVTRAFLKGMGEEAKWVEACSANVGHCRGCFTCWSDTPGKCILDDDMTQIIEDFTHADLVIWSTPQYAYGMPAPLKAILDRLLPLSLPDQKTDEFGKTNQIRRVPFPRQMLISGCGFADMRLNCEPLMLQFEYFFGRDYPYIYCAQAPLLAYRSAHVITEPYMKAVEQAGREYKEQGSISPETQKKLNSSMLPSDIYRKMVNLSVKTGHFGSKA